jgi:hypothetical protein
MELAPFEADRLPDQDRLLECRQVEQAETPLVITILRDLVERQLPFHVVPLPRGAGSAVEKPAAARPPCVDMALSPLDVPCAAFIAAQRALRCVERNQ